MSLATASNLVKTYGSLRALDGFDMTVEAGRIVGLIGPNGSGKTTALKGMLGLIRLDGGELDVLGHNPYREREALMRRVAYIVDVGILPRWMKVCDLLDLVEGVHPTFSRSVAERGLAKTQIQKNKKVHTLSKGMIAQLHLSIVLAIEADLLILDEPTLGLDILFRQEFYDRVLGEYYNPERSVLITTHEVREIEHILTDVTLIHRGRSCLTSSMADLPALYLKVTTGSAGGDEIRKMNPLSQRQSLKGTEYILAGAQRSALERYGDVTTPNLAELFVAIIGEHK